MHKETNLLQGVTMLWTEDKLEWESSQLPPPPQFCRKLQMHSNIVQKDK